MMSGSVPSKDRASRSFGAFTLVELLVGLVIVGIVTAATTVSVSRLADAKTRSASRQQAVSRADDAAARIAMDVAAVVRSSELGHCRVQVTDSFDGGYDRDSLLVISRSMRPLRGFEETYEGGEYEIQYRIQPSVTGQDTLWRRCDAAFDPYQDSGGIAAPVGPCAGLSVEASDGENWFDQWESDRDGMPHAIRVVVTASSDDGRTTWTARRVIAIDRVPIPPPEPEETEEEGSTTGTGGAGGSGGGSGGGR